MKVGIVTITGCANYGNSLQNYAVEQILIKKGYMPITLIDKSQTKLVRAKMVIYNLMHWNKSKQNIEGVQKKRKKAFGKFDKQYLHKKYCPKTEGFEYIIYGSDQIWNCTFGKIAGNLAFYLGEQIPMEKKISLAASIGVDDIPKQYIKIYEKCLGDFKALSVREYKAKELIKEILGKTDIEVTCDPTFMLSANEWMKISERPKSIVPSEKYIFVYFLGDLEQSIRDFIKSIADYYEFSIIEVYNDNVPLSRIEEENNYYHDPANFVWLIAHAQMVITDSFHGCVFSVIFKKPFRWFSRNQARQANMNSRIETLFKKMQLSEWCVGKINEHPQNILDTKYFDVDQIIENERKNADEYLKKSLGESN